MPTSSTSDHTYIAVPFYKRRWLSRPFGSASGTKVQLDNGMFIEFDFKGNVVTATKDSEAKQLATLESANNAESISGFQGKIHGSTFEIDVRRFWLSGNTTITAVHHPSGRNATLKPFGHTTFNFWPGLRMHARPFDSSAVWQKRDDPRHDDFALSNEAFILNCEPAYEELGQVLVALLLMVHRDSVDLG